MAAIAVSPAAQPASPHGRFTAAGPLERSLRAFVRYPSTGVGLVLVLLIVVGSIGAPLWTAYDPAAQQRGGELTAPSLIHLFGTDEFGRDIFARILYGGRASLFVGGISVLASAFVGALIGLVAGARGGWAESVLMRAVDVMLVFPAVLWGVAIVAVLGPSLGSLAFAVGLINVPNFARLARAGALAEVHREYIEAARALGAGQGRLLVRHVFPNIASPLLVQVALAMAFAIQLEAGLSFLGLGVQPPDPSWGAMLNTSRDYLYRAPWYGIFPGLVLAALLVGLNFLSDGIGRALDPRRMARVQ